MNRLLHVRVVLAARARAIPTYRASLLALAFAWVPVTAHSQDTLPPRQATPLPTVQVTIAREAARSTLDLPFAVTRTTPDSARPGLAHASLDELLQHLPGVTVSNRGNPTQDPRIAIRGFGARSAFGVRGIRVLRDGIPLTLPDGQTPVDYLDLESVGSIEVIRGSASALYGNAAGGVIDIRTAEPPPGAFGARLRLWGDSEDGRRVTAFGGGTVSSGSYQLHATASESDGYRRHARQELRSAFLRARWESMGTRFAVQGMGYDMPEAQNPGALTEAQARNDPRMADVANVAKRAGKAVQQGQVGITIERPIARATIEGSLYGGTRDLDNPLAFRVIDIGRVTYGGSLRARMPARTGAVPHRLGVGLDVQWQDDDRRNFENCNGEPTSADCPTAGTERGAILLDQRERISSIGISVHDEVVLGSRLLVTGAVRADRVRFEVDDALVGGTDPDDSGERTLSAVSPMAGVVLQMPRRVSLYANLSSAFETPTVTELATQPDGSAGLNPDLDPQHATTLEAGVKGTLFSRVRYDVAAFATRVRDELIPYEVPGGGGRRYFRNAGRTRRTGAEAGLTLFAAGIEAGLAASYSDFTFSEYVVDDVSYAGNRLPGIPRQQLQTYLTWRPGRLFVSTEAIVTASAAADDANQVRIPGHEVVHLRAGGTPFRGASWFSPVIGVQNLFDRAYTPSVNVNATGGKYYEPAPGRVFNVGLTVGFGS